MFELILSAIVLGFMLSLVFIGPIFFLLIETSFSRGPKHALALDLGVISADLLCILAAYYASADIVTLIDKHPGFYRITAILILVYGIVMMVTKTKMHIPGEEKFMNQNYFKTFMNGFFFNLLNVGVILFWLVTVISVRNQYPDTGNFILYIGIVIGTYLFIDLVKIFLAKQFHDKLTQSLANKIRRIVGGILIVFSFFIFLQSFKKFNQFDKRLEEAEKTEIKYQKKQMTDTIFPKALEKGDTIAVISPAGSVEPAQLEKGIEMIRKKGYEPVLGKHLYTKFSNGYSYAGTEEERLKDMNRALNDPEISAVWASRGGYGCQHLINGLDLKGFAKNPKWYIGYSDNTVIQSYLLKKGFASVHGQTVKTSSFGVTPESYDLIFDILDGSLPEYSIRPHENNKPGSVKGELVGGNLALIYALLGTKYSFDFKNKILFIEDIGENFYALDRMMMSLELAGVFSKISGLIIGGMTNMGDEKENMQYEESFDEFAYRLISERIAKYDFPVVFGFPNGHIRDNRPLIIGGEIQLKIGKTVSINYIK